MNSPRKSTFILRVGVSSKFTLIAQLLGSQICKIYDVTGSGSVTLTGVHLRSFKMGEAMDVIAELMCTEAAWPSMVEFTL